jgi:hypothetical protein
VSEEKPRTCPVCGEQVRTDYVYHVVDCHREKEQEARRACFRAFEEDRKANERSK